MNSYKKAEIIDALMNAASNPDSICLYLTHIFKEKKVGLYSSSLIFLKRYLSKLALRHFSN